MEYKRLKASQVRLDSQNPRLPEGTSSDHEAINRLLDENFSALLALTRDMVETGESNPAELPIVLKDGTKYLVLEGNRRFAALKLLANPSLADDEKHRAAFTRLAKKGTPPKSVMCAVDASRGAADHWLVLRHTGANRGVGVRGWTAEQIATHRQRANASIDAGTARSLVIADELEEAYARDTDMVAAMRRVRATKLTNIGRFFAGEVMSRLHLAIKDTEELYARERTLWARHSTEDLHDFFAWAIEYIDQNSVDAYKNAQIRSALLDQHHELLPDTSGIETIEETRLADFPWVPTDEDDGSDDGDNDDRDGDDDTNGDGDGGDRDDDDGDEDDGEGDTSGQGKRKNEAKPEKRLFQDLKLGHMSPRTQFILKEARQIEHDESPGIACVMARVIVELVVSETKVRAWSGAEEKDAIKDKVVACLKVLDPDYHKGRPGVPALNPAYLETKDEAIGIRFMHQFVHNPDAHPDPHMSRRFSSRFRPLLEAIDSHTRLQTP